MKTVKTTSSKTTSKSSSTISTPNRFRLPKSESYAARHIDNMVVLYSRATGQTHMADILSGICLEKLKESAATVEDLAIKLSGEYGVEYKEAIGPVREALGLLSHRGLIEPIL